MKRRVSIVALCALFVCFFSTLRPHAAVTAPPPPISLTNPDGQALILEKYDLRVAVNGALSLTEMEMTFRNPEARQMEGRFLYLLPPGATISRFAKEVNGKLMEGEVVEKLRAQSIYTEILHTMRDPALLEMDQGNRFSARVFPIAASGTVRLLLSYSQVLPLKNGERKLTIPLAGMPQIAELNFSAHFGDGQSVRGIPGGEDAGKNMSRQFRAFAPEKDIELTFKPDSTEKHEAVKAGNYQMLRYFPKLPWKDREILPTDWAVYFDTSASNADTEARRLAASETLLNKLVPVLREKDKLFSAYAFDIEVKELLKPTSMNSFGSNQPIMPRIVNDLRGRHALGATNLAQTMKHIGENARASSQAQTFVLVSDGIATLGAREARDVVAALGDWPENDVLHVLVLDNKQDEKMLAAIVEKTRGRVITASLNDTMDKEISAALGSMQVPLGQSFEIYDEGAAWIYPRTFRDVQPGQELIVFSELKNGAASKPGFIQRGPDGKIVKDETPAIAPSEIADFAPLLQREAQRAQLDHLEKAEQAETVDTRRAELRKQRLEISVKNRVLCPLTSLLVLETENDYRRFGIDRTALADIMQVGKNGIELRKRGADEVPPPAPQVATKRKAEAKKLAENAAPAKAAEALEKSVGDELKDLAGDLKADDGAREVDTISGVAEESRGERRRALAQGGGRGAADAPHPFAGAAPAPSSPQPAEAPVARDPNSPPTPAARTAAPLQDAARRVNSAEEKLQRPEWTSQYGTMPSEEQLNILRAKVQGAPRDRTLRNAYADALKKAQKWDSLQGEVFEWLPFDPENPQVFEYLGNSATGLKDDSLALRAITSIAEIAPNRAALLARAGWLLLVAKKYEMAREMFTEALKNRKDDANIYRGLAYTYWLSKDFDNASKTLEDALKVDFNSRYGDVKRVINEEMGYITRSKKAATGEKSASAPDAIRVTLAWETDANDVDLHVVDPSGEECFYGHKENKSGLELYSDQTQGLGPEVIRAKKTIPGVYHVGVNYFSAGPMGVSRGVVVIMQPKDGVVEEPVIVPFCLVPGGPDIRHLGAAEFK